MYYSPLQTFIEKAKNCNTPTITHMVALLPDLLQLLATAGMVDLFVLRVMLFHLFLLDKFLLSFFRRHLRQSVIFLGLLPHLVLLEFCTSFLVNFIHISKGLKNSKKQSCFQIRV